MTGSFRERARFEASRYGSDPWVFVRELLQNARDAGARHVAFEARAEEGGQWLSCRDDGAGMTFAHARRYLFRLYTSSKEREISSAGRFGVGFWSILRFEPERIVIRSWPRAGAPWQVVLEGDLARGSQGRPEAEGPPGTEIVLARRARLRAARLRGGLAGGTVPRPAYRPEEPLPVTVNGRPVSANGERGDERPAGSPSIEGIAPRALLDSDEIEPLLARADVRDDRALRRLVRLARRETDRLLGSQIDRAWKGSRKASPPYTFATRHPAAACTWRR